MHELRIFVEGEKVPTQVFRHTSKDAPVGHRLDDGAGKQSLEVVERGCHIDQQGLKRVTLVVKKL